MRNCSLSASISRSAVATFLSTSLRKASMLRELAKKPKFLRSHT